jgi:ABC-type transport system involved in multi-copper enzyme maturation permease subunit
MPASPYTLEAGRNTRSSERDDMPAKAPGLSATIASEWSKLTATRSTYTMAGISCVLAVGITVGVAFAIGGTWKHWSAADKADFSPIETSYIGLIFSAILLLVLGVRAVSSEYSTGMIKITLTATPNRARLFAAKMIVVAAITTAVGLVTSLVSFVVGQLVFHSSGVPTASLADGDAIRSVLVEGAVSPVYPLMGAALAILFRSVTAALTGTLVLTFAPAVLASVLSGRWQKILRYTPGAASDSLSFAHSSDSSSRLGIAIALVVIVAWLAAFLGAAHILFRRRDA